MQHGYYLIYWLLGLLLSLPLSVAAQQQRTTKWASGQMQGGQKIGVWEYYGYAGNGEQLLMQRYDHSSGQLLYFRPDGQEYLAEVQPGEWQKTLLTQPPWGVGGIEAIASLTAGLRYPPAAELRNVQGRVIVSFLIDTLGTASGYKVVQGIGAGCDEEALRLVRKAPIQWVPGRLNGRTLPVMYELPIVFRLR